MFRLNFNLTFINLSIVKPMKRILLLALFCFAVLLSGRAQNMVSFDQASITYMGRIENISNDCAKIYWPGSSVSINFEGTEVKALLQNGPGTSFFYAIVDGDALHAQRIKPDTGKTSYTLASGLKPGKHSVQLFKLTDNTTFTKFYGFELNEGSKVLEPLQPSHRKIEFYGNSITVGHGVDVPAGMDDSGEARYFNNYKSYAAITARYFDAQYSCIARSGIGIMISWFPEIMPEIFDRLNPMDAQSKWDFSNYTPDVVVVNLFQNDSWLVNMPEHPQFKARFGTTAPKEKDIVSAYQSFIAKIRGKYPKASIICALGNMDATRDGSPWPGYVESAVKNLADPKIYTHFFTYKDTPDHPKVTEQQAMADDLIRFIEKNISW
jgi:hypothetical protein